MIAAFFSKARDAASMKLQTKDEIFSAMVVYGFLSCDNGKVSVPNKEIMDQFREMLKKEVSPGYVYRLAKESERMLRATLEGGRSDPQKKVRAAFFGKNGRKDAVYREDSGGRDCL